MRHEENPFNSPGSDGPILNITIKLPKVDFSRFQRRRCIRPAFALNQEQMNFGHTIGGESF